MDVRFEAFAQLPRKIHDFVLFWNYDMFSHFLIKWTMTRTLPQ